MSSISLIRRRGKSPSLNLYRPFKMYPENSIGVLINSSKSFNDLSVEVEAVRVINHFELVLSVECCLYSSQDQCVLKVV
ncbi:hypothetical protein Tco_0193468 [Tanacetum coccineum]